MTLTVVESYLAQVTSGQLERDEAQLFAAKRLDDVRLQLIEAQLAHKNRALGWLFGRKISPVQGLYIWGDVGRGKSMLMDLFFNAVPFPYKKRVHFHAFMGDVHQRIHQFRQALKAGTVKGDDPIAPVARDIAQNLRLLCFDEFFVRDIADAMILGRLFEQLFEQGVVIVATSNVEPDALYQGGLNRDLFIPFIAQLKKYLGVICLQARADFRLEKLAGEKVYFMPVNSVAEHAMFALWQKVTGLKGKGEPDKLEVLGRILSVPQAHLGVARFDCAALVDAALAANDFLALAARYHTVFIDRIPLFRSHQRNQVKRFILLIDAFYEARVKLIASAEAAPVDLCVEGEHVFEFQRTASRLIEMQSSAYFALPHQSPLAQAGAIDYDEDIASPSTN